MYHLIVVHPFGVYAKGQAITDPDEVAGMLAGTKHVYVNKVPDTPGTAWMPLPEPSPSRKSDK